MKAAQLLLIPLLVLLLGLAQTSRAQRLQAHPKVKISPLTINSEADDFAPCFLPVTNTLFFTSERDAGWHSGQQIYASESWSAPERVAGEVNDATHSGAATLTLDGQRMIFAAFEHSAGSRGRTDLYSARNHGGRWEEVHNLGPAINSPAWDSQPWLSPDGQWLFFVSDRPGGYGGTDIYVARRNVDGSWGIAQNAGPQINSAADEMSPSLAPDGKTFYFASNRPGGAGGFDIYTATFSNGKFQDVRRVTAGINSPADELFFVALPNSNTAYFASNRPGGMGGYDLYSAIPNPVPPAPVRIVRGIVRDKKSKQPLGAKIIITDLKTGQKLSEFASDPVTGMYYVVLPAGRDYAITAEHPGYLFFSERFTVPKGAEGKEVRYDIELSPLQGGFTRLLIFFDFDKAELKPESRAELQRVVAFLKAHPQIRIRIEGHTDDVGDEQYNLELSKRRAEAVRRYLIDHGIDPSRIEAVGYGETRPLVPNTSEAARAKNRRVEMHIIP